MRRASSSPLFILVENAQYWAPIIYYGPNLAHHFTYQATAIQLRPTVLAHHFRSRPTVLTDHFRCLLPTIYVGPNILPILASCRNYYRIYYLLPVKLRSYHNKKNFIAIKSKSYHSKKSLKIT
jgi:hypothetical protein